MSKSLPSQTAIIEIQAKAFELRHSVEPNSYLSECLETVISNLDEMEREVKRIKTSQFKEHHPK